MADGNYSKTSYKFESENVPDSSEEPSFPNIVFSREGSLGAAKALHELGERPCVLNFANNDIAGGGFNLKGNTQEEVLMKRTTLEHTLPKEYYPIDTVVDEYRYWDYKKLALVYSPSVCVIRDSNYDLLAEPYTISVITCAAINNPMTSGDEYRQPRDREVTRRKIQMILDTAKLQGHNNLVAGQWGCGAFGNPLEICKLWVEEIAKRRLKVVFPIFNREFGYAIFGMMIKYAKPKKTPEGNAIDAGISGSP